MPDHACRYQSNAKCTDYFWSKLSKPNANSTQSNSKQLALRLDTVATWNPPHHHNHPPTNFSVTSRQAKELKCYEMLFLHRNVKVITSLWFLLEPTNITISRLANLIRAMCS